MEGLFQGIVAEHRVPGPKMPQCRDAPAPKRKAMAEAMAAFQGLASSSRSMPSSSRACARMTSFSDSCTATCHNTLPDSGAQSTFAPKLSSLCLAVRGADGRKVTDTTPDRLE